MENDIKELEAELEKAREDLIPNTSTDHIKLGQGSTKTPFDTSQTERIGIKLAENKAIRGLEGLLRDTKRRYNALREVRTMLEKDELQFIWLRYDKNKSHTQTMMALSDIGACMSRATYFRFRQVVINKIARYMGLIKSL
jgi:hypothetical protein